jgi:class 3 adenylate cyclase/TolB-like protein
MNAQHRLAAVWFADIVGFTSQAAADEARALRIVQSFQESAREVARRHGGRIVKFIGDAAMAEFSSTESAVRAAAALPEACQRHAERAGVACPTLRVAVHVGDVTTTPDGDVYGDGVNTAARIVKAVDPGELWVSEDVWRQLRNRPAIRLEERGARELKDLGPTRAWAVAGVEGEEARAASPIARARAFVTDPRGRIVTAALAVVGLVLVWLVLRQGGPGGDGARAVMGSLDPARIAVLYLEDLTPDSASGHLAAGFTEAIIDQLSGVEGLDVVSRHGVEPFRGGAAPVDSVARALGAGTIVGGSVERRGDRVAVRIRMLDPAGNRQIETWTEERPWSELLPLQETVAEDIVARLRQRLGEQLRMATRRSGTTNVEAWELVERAERLAEQARVSGDDPDVKLSLRRQADQLLTQAEGLDPGWVEPTIARAEVAAWMGDEESYRRGVALASGALERDPGSARALAVRGALYDSLASVAEDSVTVARYLAQAQRDLRTAVAADPRLAPAWIGLASLLYNDLWDLAQARDAARRAYEADAFLLEEDHFAWLCETSAQLEDYPEVERWCGEGLRRFPERIRLMMAELSAMASDGPEPDVARAWELVERIGRQEYPEFNVPLARMTAAIVVARAGLQDSARSVVETTRRSAGSDIAPYLDVYDARVQLALGNRASSIRLLRSFFNTVPDYRALIARDPWFKALAGDPAFEALVDRRRAPIFCRLLCEPPG